MKLSRNTVTISAGIVVFALICGNGASQQQPDIANIKFDPQEFLHQSYRLAFDNPTDTKKMPSAVTSAPPSVQGQYNRSHMSMWTLGYNEGQWDDFLHEMEAIPISPPSGVDQQPIQPSRATSAWGGRNFAAQEWKARVNAWKKRQEDAGMMTCDAAIGVLYTHVCSDTESCDIEAEYESKCAKKHHDQNAAKICVAVVEDYKEACFSGDSDIYFDFRTLSAGGTSKRPLCNVVSFNHRGTVATATARHCVDNRKTPDRITSRFHQDNTDGTSSLEFDFTRTTEGPFAAVGDFTFVNSDYANQVLLTKSVLASAQATEYSPTFFAANSGFALLRNEVVELNNLDLPTWGLYLIDLSPLCTVVQHSDGELLHTCQSSKGSSGGALIQKNETWHFIVGVNTGRSSKDSRTTNFAQFATPSAFRE